LKGKGSGNIKDVMMFPLNNVILLRGFNTRSMM